MRFRTLLSIVLSAWFVPAAVGCYPVTQLQGPRTVAAGELQGGIAVGFAEQPARLSGWRHLPLDAALRVGVSDRVDLSFRARPELTSLRDSVYELGTKIQLVREETVELSIAPSVMQAFIDYGGFDNEEITPDERAYLKFGRLAVLLGTNADDVGSFWVAPTIDVGIRQLEYNGALYTEPLVALGSCAGIGLRLGPHVQLLFQGGLTVGAAGSDVVVIDQRYFESILGPGDLIMEATLGVLIGGFSG